MDIQAIKNLLDQPQDTFSVTVVTNHFYIATGREYFKSIKNKQCHICNNVDAIAFLEPIIQWISKNIPDISKLFDSLLNGGKMNLANAISVLSKLFSPETHTAVGPNIIDPIIIYEANVSVKQIEKIVSLHKNCFFKPLIIIVLRDNDIERAKKILSNCPNNIIVRLIGNNCRCEDYRIINTGADNIDDFIDAYSRQSFSTCSNTKKNIIFNSKYMDNPILNDLTAPILKVRSDFLEDKKDYMVKEQIDSIFLRILSFELETSSNSNDHKLLQCFKCMALLFNIYCTDKGNGLNEAFNLATQLDNDILKAHVYRFSHYSNVSMNEKENLYAQAIDIFRKNQISDHAAYCENNKLVLSYYTDHVSSKTFNELLIRAQEEVPGLVGMPIIASNTGTAYLYNANFEQAIDIYNKYIPVAVDQKSQQFGMKCNKEIARALNNDKVDEETLLRLKNSILYSFGDSNIPFITANLLANLVGIAVLQKQMNVIPEILDNNTRTIFHKALFDYKLGTGSLVYQLNVLNKKSNNCYPIDEICQHLPKSTSVIQGKRKAFIETWGLNPTIHNAWL